MKKVTAILIAFALCLSFAACKREDDTQIESTTEAVTETTTQEMLNFEETLQAAREVYAAFLVRKISETPDSEGTPDSALVVDLDKNGIPEVICRSGELHETYILSYGEHDGFSVIIPMKNSMLAEEIYFSEESGVLYFIDNGHTVGTLEYHEGVCLKADSEGFQTVGTLSGDEWDVDPKVWENEELVYKYSEEYDKEFNESMKKLVGEGTFKDFEEECVEENAWEYLSEELSINLTEKKAEYEMFQSKAIAAVGEDDLLSIHVSDFDRNGTFEAFAVTGQKKVSEEDETSYKGEVWFVSDDGSVETAGEEEIRYTSEGEILTCQYHDYFQIQKLAASAVPAFLATVSDGECSVVSDFSAAALNFFENEKITAHSNSLVAGQNAYDAFSDGTGHTGKPYFYYDTPNGIREYGGTEISMEQLEKLGGAKCIEKFVSEEYTVENIYLRGNGIINVNLTKSGSNNCIVIKITNHSVKNITDWWNDIAYDDMMEGHYSPAATPELATYPDLADFGL